MGFELHKRVSGDFDLIETEYGEVCLPELFTVPKRRKISCRCDICGFKYFSFNGVRCCPRCGSLLR